MQFYENQLRQQYRLLKHEGHWTQGSCYDTHAGQQLDRRLLNGEEEVIEWARRTNSKGNIFVGRAPRDKDGQPIHATCLSLDLDPKRPKGTAATAAQNEACLRVARHLIREFGCGAVCSSGNGALIIFSLPNPVGKEEAESLGKALEQQAKAIITDPEVEVDHTYDLARLVKAMGTISTKGDKALWRYARFTGVGDARCTEGFLGRFKSLQETVSKGEFVPTVHKGELDRSKADIALANRLRIQGFDASYAYRALQQYSFRPGREDDYKRIIDKVYGNRGDVSDLVSGRDERPLEVITPTTGLENYRSRGAIGTPELPTGFTSIDTATFGLIRKHIFTVGGRRNAGKTTFAIGAALNLCRTGKRVLYLSTESPYEEVWDRYIAVGTGASAFALQNGLKLNGHQQHVDKFMQEFTTHNLFIHPGSRPSIGVVRRLVEQVKPDVLIFDYFQHQEARDVRQLEEFVFDLHDLAKEHNFAVLITAQLHDRRNPATNKPYPVCMNDMKNCKVINDESRVVLLLDWDSEGNKSDGPAAVKCVMAKNKGKHVDVVLKLDRSVPMFVEELV